MGRDTNKQGEGGDKGARATAAEGQVLNILHASGLDPLWRFKMNECNKLGFGTQNGYGGSREQGTKQRLFICRWRNRSSVMELLYLL